MSTGRRRIQHLDEKSVVLILSLGKFCKCQRLGVSRIKKAREPKGAGTSAAFFAQ